MKYIYLCRCEDCGGDVISRHNGNVGFCEDCHNMYELIIEDDDENKGR